jgi:tetratricopeptide (TPR) repeat protein
MARKQPNKTTNKATSQRPSRPVPIAVYAIVILAAGLWAFSNSFVGAFMGDDADAIVANPHIKQLFPPTAPVDTTLAGRPVATFSFSLNYALAPADARDAMQPKNLAAPLPEPGEPFLRNLWGYHVVNVSIHLLAALTLFGVVRRTLNSPALAETFSTVASPFAVAVALIWVVHPLQTASVTYLVQRVESLMGLFYLLTIYCVIRAAESNFQHRGWIAAAIAFCALGMGTKESMVTAPIVAALWIHICWPSARLMGPPRWLLLGLAATWVVVIGLSLTPNRSLSVGFTIGGWSWWLYLRTQAAVLVHYLQLALWPSQLVFQYQWMPASSWGAVLPQLLFLAALGGATLFGIIRRSPWALPGAWFFLVLAPSSSILPIASEVAADHRMYLPLAAVIAAALAGLIWLVSRTALVRAPFTKYVSWALVAVIVLALGVRTRARNEDYRSWDIMAPTIVAAEPHNVVAQVMVGSALVRRQRFSEGEVHLKAALEAPLPLGGSVQPYALARMMLGIAAGAQNRHQEAVDHLRESITMMPALREPHGLIAESYLKLGKISDALAEFDRGVAAFPDAANWLARSAWVRATTTEDSLRDGKRAVMDAENALKLLKGSDLPALLALAAAQAETRDFAAALATLTSADNLARNDDMRARLQAYRALFNAHQPIRTASW